MKIMVVEDEKDIREILRGLLSDEGYEVVLLENGQTILSDLGHHEPDLLLLDQILPGKKGVDIIKEIRGDSRYEKLPIIMVTGLSGETDKVSALDLGADDYVTKPFYPRELSARIKALARRAVHQDAPIPENIKYKNLEIDFTAHRVLLDSKEISLTLTEFKILTELLKHLGQVLSREKLREKALGNLNVTDRTIDVHMASLRKKLEALGDSIQTVRGVGYRFSEDGN